MTSPRFLVKIPLKELTAQHEPLVQKNLNSIYFKLQGHEVVIISKWKDEELAIVDLKFIDRKPLVRCVTGQYKDQIFLINRDWLKPVSKPASVTHDEFKSVNYNAGGDVNIMGGQDGGCGQAASVNSDLTVSDGTKQLLHNTSSGEGISVNYRKTQKSHLSKPEKSTWKREKELLKQHIHANQCLLKEKVRRSHERVDIILSRHEVYKTFIRWSFATVTLLGTLYMAA